MEVGFWEILWTICGVVTIVAALLAGRSAWWRQVGRAATGVLFLIGGALMHVITLATGGDYAGFADPALFQWVTDSWRAVVAPNQLFFIGLLIVFEAAVGLLVVSGGRRTQLGYLGIIAFYLALWLFGRSRRSSCSSCSSRCTCSCEPSAGRGFTAIRARQPGRSSSPRAVSMPR